MTKSEFKRSMKDLALLMLLLCITTLPIALYLASIQETTK